MSYKLKYTDSSKNTHVLQVTMYSQNTWPLLSAQNALQNTHFSTHGQKQNHSVKLVEDRLLQLCCFLHCAIRFKCVPRHLYVAMYLIYTSSQSSTCGEKEEVRRVFIKAKYNLVSGSHVFSPPLHPPLLTLSLLLCLPSPSHSPLPPYFLFWSYKHISFLSPCFFHSLLPLLMSHG